MVLFSRSHLDSNNITSTVMSRIKVGRKRQLENNELVDIKRSIGHCKQLYNPVVETESGTEKSEKDVQSADGSKQKAVATDLQENRLKAEFLERTSCQWKDIRAENLFLQLTNVYNEVEADSLLTICEEELVYNVGELATVKLFGKRINIPRKQVAHGDNGLTYTFSGNTVPARPWTPMLLKIWEHISRVTGLSFNFVLINRYNDGHDYMGEHKDDEKDLLPSYPIASLTLGQPREFMFRHQESRGKHAKRRIDSVKITLEHGMLLLMKHPTNSFWYHSLPRRTKALGVRVNMTFRKMQPPRCKPVKTPQLL